MKKDLLTKFDPLKQKYGLITIKQTLGKVIKAEFNPKSSTLVKSTIALLALVLLALIF